MSQVSVTPDVLTAAAADLENIGAMLDAAHTAAAPAIAELVPAAADEVSADVARLFAGHGQDYQAAAHQAAAYQEQFAQNLTTSAVSYGSAEGVNDVLVSGYAVVTIAPSVALFLAAVAYTGWVYPYLGLLPEGLVNFAYLPATFLTAAAFGHALFWLGIGATVASFIGLM